MEHVPKARQPFKRHHLVSAVPQSNMNHSALPTCYLVVFGPHILTRACGHLSSNNRCAS